MSLFGPPIVPDVDPARVPELGARYAGLWQRCMPCAYEVEAVKRSGSVLMVIALPLDPTTGAELWSSGETWTLAEWDATFGGQEPLSERGDPDAWYHEWNKGRRGEVIRLLTEARS